MPQPTPVERDDSVARFSFPAVHRKKVTAAFDGARLISNGEVLLLAQANHAMGICRHLAACMAEPVRNHQRMPFSTRRLSTRGMPRGLFDSSGSMIDHSQSVSSYRRRTSSLHRNEEPES